MGPCKEGTVQIVFMFSRHTIPSDNERPYCLYASSSVSSMRVTDRDQAMATDKHGKNTSEKNCSPGMECECFVVCATKSSVKKWLCYALFLGVLFFKQTNGMLL